MRIDSPPICRARYAGVVVWFFWLSACRGGSRPPPSWPTPPPSYPPPPAPNGGAPRQVGRSPPGGVASPAFEQTGEATYYANSLAGNKTASGQVYDPRALTAAHKQLAFGTRVRVTRTDTSQTVIVTINDRGPFAGPNRIIDLSYAAAQKLDMLRSGVVPVRLEVVESP